MAPKAPKNKAARTKDAPTRFPKPNATTAKIVAAAVAVSALAWFFGVKPAGERMADADAATEKVEAALQRDSQLLRAYQTGDIVQGDRLAGATEGVEALLPLQGGGVGEVYATVEGAAKSLGLEVSDFEINTSYQEPPEPGGYPDVVVAQASMRVSGSIESMKAFLATLESYPQLITYTSSGVSGDQRSSTMVLEMGLWASTFPEWRNGVPADDPSRGASPKD